MTSSLRLYVIGDIHGRADLLQTLFRLIDDHRAAAPPARCQEILLGDYVDRGPASCDVIDLILDRTVTHAVTALAGNHEAMMLEALGAVDAMPAWLANGGRETLASYGVASPARRSDPLALQTAACAAIPSSHRDFLAGLPLAARIGGYFFAHAGVRPGVTLDRQNAADLLWIREPFLSHGEPFEAVVVHGHSPVERPDVRTNRINVDTGAFASSRLTCLVLEGDTIGFLST